MADAEETSRGFNKKESNHMQQVANTLPMAFTHVSGQLRSILRNNEPWFIAKDVCDAIGIKNPADAVRSLDPDEKGIASTDTLRGIQEALIVNESGMYALIFKSRKKEAQQFRKWITNEVLPSIRQRGMYVQGQQQVRRELLDTLAVHIREKALPALREYDRLTESLHWYALKSPEKYRRGHELAVNQVALSFDLPKSLVEALTAQGLDALLSL
jgi:prophage antirepressor-like protein